MEDKKYFVHESSYVDDDVQIGEGTKIWHFCHVQKGAQIGKNCSLGIVIYAEKIMMLFMEQICIVFPIT